MCLVEELKKYDTERLLLPIETVYNRKGEFNGYTTRFINGGNLSTISKMKMHKMLDEMNLYTEDVKLLTKNGVLIDDLYIDNIVYGDGLYSCDPGSFKKEENMTEREIERENKHILNELFINDIFGICCGLTKKQRKKLEEMVLSGDYLSDLFSYDDINKNESTLHFMKGITKQ